MLRRLRRPIQIEAARRCHMDDLIHQLNMSYPPSVLANEAIQPAVAPMQPLGVGVEEGHHIRRRRRTIAQWNERKQKIFELYIKGNRSIDDVVKELRAAHFPTSRRQLLNKLKEWKFFKHFSHHHRQAIRRIENRRRNYGKATSFRLSGTVVPTEKITRSIDMCSDNGVEVPEPAEAPTPSEISYFTPDGDPDIILREKCTPRATAQSPSGLSFMDDLPQYERPSTELMEYYEEHDRNHDIILPTQSSPWAMLQMSSGLSPMHYPWMQPETSKNPSDFTLISHNFPPNLELEEPRTTSMTQKILPWLFIDLPFLESANMHQIELLERSRILSPLPTSMGALFDLGVTSVLPAECYRPLETFLAPHLRSHAGEATTSLCLTLSKFLPKGYLEELLSQDAKFWIKTQNGRLQLIFHLATYLFSNNLLSWAQEYAFINWLISGAHIDSLKEFLKFPTPSVRAFKSNLLAACEISQVNLWRQLVDANVHSVEIAQQALKLGCGDYLLSVLKELDPKEISGRPGGLLLREIARTDQIEAAKYLIDQGAEVDIALSDTRVNTTALWEAIDRSKSEMVELLINNGADVKRQGMRGCTHSYLRLCVPHKPLKILQLLLDNGAKITKWIVACANDTDLMDFMLQYHYPSSDVSVKEIVSAADSGEAVWREFLKQHSPFPVEIIELALLMAIRDTKVRVVVNLLQHGVNPDCPHLEINPLATLIMDCPADSGTIACLRLLIGYGADVKSGDLLLSVLLRELGGDITEHSIQLLTELLNAGLDIETQGARGLEVALLEYSDELAFFLLSKGAPINLYGEAFTSVQAAAREGNLHLVKILVERGADIHKPAYEVGGLTALQAAAYSGSAKLLEYLLEKKAEINSPPAMINGMIPLEAVVWPGVFWLTLLNSYDSDGDYDQRAGDPLEAFQFLLGKGAEISRRDGTSSPLLHDIIERRHPGLLRCALDNQARVDFYWKTISSSFKDRTPLQLAAETGQLDLVQMLLEHSADPNSAAAYSYGRTPLQAAASSELPNEEIVQLLITKGAEVNAPPAFIGGITALQGAAICGHINIALLLIENGADVNASPAPKRGRTAVEGAAENGRLDMVKMLLNAGATGDVVDGKGFEKAIKLAKENDHLEVARLLEELW
ncbi:ankyrin repeat-containing domain protein [Xylaria sp. FL0933]|nr:ankyrin repeat-containing domain protein [Xylaria sp. FL0933]